MKLTEKPGENPKNILGEEVVKNTITETNTNINADDFTVDDFESTDTPAPEGKAPPTPPEELIEDTTKTVDKKEVITPDGTKTIHTTTTETSGLNEVKANAVKPDIAFTMWDLFMPKIGSVVYPDTPSDHWKFKPHDKKDLTILIEASAKEGDWKGIPTKWFLLLALAAIVLFMWKNRNNHKVTAETNTNSLTQTADNYKLKQDFEAKLAKYEERIDAVIKKNEQLEKQLASMRKDPYYEEIPPDEMSKAQKLADEAKVLVENIYKGHDLEKIRFSVNGGFVEREKAGTKGYNLKGVKIGVPSAEMKEVFAKWKLYHESKGNEIPYFVA